MLKRGLRKKTASQISSRWQRNSGDHESGGHGAGRHFDTRLMNNFNTGQVVFRPIAGNVPSLLY